MDRLVAFVLRQQTLMVALLVFVCGTRLVSFFRLNIEAYPDPVPPLVDIVTQAPGQSAEEIERYVTIPVDSDVGYPARLWSGRSRCSACPTSRCSLLTMSPTIRPSGGDDQDRASCRRGRRVRHRRSRPPVPSARSTATTSSGRRDTRSPT